MVNEAAEQKYRFLNFLSSSKLNKEILAIYGFFKIDNFAHMTDRSIKIDMLTRMRNNMDR